VALSTPLLRQYRFTSSRSDAVLVAPIPAKTKNNRLAVGRFLGVAGGNWGRPGALLQHRQPPPTDPPSPNSTDPKISAFSNVTFTSLRSSTVRTRRDCRNSWAPCRISIRKASAPSFKEPPLPFAPTFWKWVEPSTTVTHWSLLMSWVLILKSLETCFQALCSFCQLQCQTYPYQT